MDVGARQLNEAITAATRAADRNPDSVENWHDLGLLYFRAGKLEQSRRCLERAIRVDPAHASSNNHLAVTLLAMGRTTEAERYAGRASHLLPSSTLARITHAYAAGAARGNDVALALIDGILAGSPDDIAALAARGDMLLRLERYAEAAATADRGLALAPENGIFLETLGSALRGMGEAEAAIGALDRAITAGHRVADMLVLRAACQLEAGDFAGARAGLERVQTLEPDHPHAWSWLAELDTFEPGDPAIAQMEELLASSPRLRVPDARSVMHYALGRAYQKAGDPKHAFEHFVLGNGIQRRSIGYDARTDETFCAEQIARFGPDAFARLADNGDPDFDPIFVIGMPRSGTSLVEQILASHPAVFGAGELTFFEQAIATADTAALTPAGLAAIAQRYRALVATLAPDGRLVDKLPANYQYAGLIHLVFPRARIVHCVRDAVNTCFSCYTTRFTGRQDFACDLTELGRYYRSYEKLTAHWRGMLPEGVMLDVAYEDVVADVEAQARRIFAFCGLDWDGAALRFYQTQRVVRTASYHQVRKPIYTSSVDAAAPFRPYLTLLEEALGLRPAEAR